MDTIHVCVKNRRICEIIRLSVSTYQTSLLAWQLILAELEAVMLEVLANNTHPHDQTILQSFFYRATSINA